MLEGSPYRARFPWMSQSTDLAKEKIFCKTRVTEFQIGVFAGLGLSD